MPIELKLRAGRRSRTMEFAGRVKTIVTTVVVGASVALGVMAQAAEPAQLILSDGVVVKFGVQADVDSYAGGLLVRGRLQTGSNVVLTSERDDQTAGPIRTGQPAAAAGDWLGLFIAPGVGPSALSIDGLGLRYAGGTNGVPGNVRQAGAALIVPGNAYSFTGLKITQSATGMLVTGAGSPQIHKSRLENNSVGLQAELGATPTVTQSSLAKNSQFGVHNLNPATPVQATGNWWGHGSGPYDGTGNPNGQGSRVSAGVIYSSYLLTDPADAPGPTLSVSYNGQPLAANATITQPGVLALSAHSAQGVAFLSAQVNGTTLLQDTYTNPGPSTEANPTTVSQLLGFESLPNGNYVLLATARDGQGGSTASSIPFVLDLKPPAAPVITSPQSGSNVTGSQLVVMGTSDLVSQVQIFVDGQAAGTAWGVDAGGRFSTSVAFGSEGSHTLQAQATNSRGTGPMSAPVTVTYTAPSPTIAFVSPADKAIVRGTVPVQVSAIDGSGITQVQIQVQQASSAQALATLTQAPWSTEWDTASLPDGDYTLIATATSRIGKLAQVSRTVRVQQIPPPPPVPPLPYGTRNVSVSPGLSFGDQSILISGQVVTLDAAAAPVPNATLRLVLRVQGFERRITLVSDAAGQFSYTFVPQSNDAGTYAVYVIHPDNAQYASQAAHGQFTINRLSFNYKQYKLNAIRGQSTPITLQARASAGTGATGVRWQALAADQPSGSLPPGISLDLGQPVDVPANAAVPMTMKLTGSAGAGATGTIILKAFANESGATPRAELRVDYQLHEATPGLSVSPSFLEIGVQQGSSASAAVTLTNRGLAVANNVRVQLMTPQGGTPPAWVRLVSSGEIGQLDIGQAVALQVMAQPGADVADGYYQFQLRVNADNDPGGTVPVTVAVAQSGQGGVRFKAVDIYTNTLDKSGNLIAGLQGATIKLQNEALTADIRTLTTNAQGLAELTDLPPGNYRWRASAPQHTDASGRLQVKAGLTVNERVFLDSQLISIEFSVTETTIRDEYNITLEATYQTQVPAPVVLLEPMSINLPDMQVGEELTGELTLNNYGMVRADDVKFTLPQSDAYYRYEFFGEMPKEMAAKSRVVIPYRITAVAPVKRGEVKSAPLPLFQGYSPSLEAQHAIRQFLETGRSPSVPQSKAEAVAKAAGCRSYGISICVFYMFTCAEGDIRTGVACAHVGLLSGSSCGDPSTGTGSSGNGSSTGTGWGTGNGAAPSTSIFTPLVRCPPSGCGRCSRGGKGPGGNPGGGNPGGGSPGGGSPGGNGPGNGPGSGGPGSDGPGNDGPGGNPNGGGSGDGGTSGGDKGGSGDGPPSDDCS